MGDRLKVDVSPLFKMGIINQISQKIDQIINSSISAHIYKSECDCIVKIFKELKDRIIDFPTNGCDDELNEILTKLNDLYKIVESLAKQNWCKVNLQISIDKPIIDIKESMNSINESLIKIRIIMVNKYDISIDDIFDDLNSIYGILADPDRINDQDVQEKLHEIENYLINIGKPLVSSTSNDKSSGKINNFNDIQKYKIKESDYIRESHILSRNTGYTIYKGQMKNTKEKVSIMVLNQSYTEEKFQRLVSVLTAVKHQNLESFIGAVESPPPYVVITRRAGKKLSEIIKRQNKKKSSDKFTIISGYKTIIAYQIATGMAYLHSSNITHRDLCTKNVLIDDELNPRIINFANSRFIPEDTLTISFDINSSSEFKAPEINSVDGYNESVDVFSFAGILYELLTGTPPFDGENDVETLIQSAQRPDFSPDINISPDLKELITSCWSQDPKKRPSFAGIMNTMLTKSITFPEDTNNEATFQFYASKKIKNDELKACFNLFKQIPEAINNSYAFSHQATRIRSFLHGYQFILQTSKYISQERIEEKDLVQFYNLRSSLENLLSTLNQTELRKWSLIALTTPALEIPNDLCQFMEQIYISMCELGFNVNKYDKVKSDLIYDFRFVLSVFENYQGPSLCAKDRIKEIEDFMFENDFDVNASQTEIDDRLSKLLCCWKDYEVDRSDFQVSRANIGDGMSCSVRTGTQISTGKKVAIKIFKQNFLNDEDSARLLRREVGFLIQLQNDYIIKFVGFNNDPGEPLWIVSENIKNGNLSDAIKRRRLSPFVKTKITFEIAEGMEYLKSQRVLHRDLKSKNILLDGNIRTHDVTPKICDFGLARSDLSISMTNKIGTANYMAPEVIKGGRYDFKADVFSFGMLIWEMYSGERPWSDSGDDALDCIVNNEPLSYKDPISNDLKQLIEDARSYDPENRPSITEIIDRMIEKKIAFKGVNPSEVKQFYDKKEEERRKKNNQE